MNMAEKRYYWLKLREGFFEQKEIKRLRRIAGGDTYTIIYLKMLLKSLKNDGFLYFEGIDDDFISELALDIDEDEDNVKVTVQYLMSKGILEPKTEDEFVLLSAKEMTGSETAAARRMRKNRNNVTHETNNVTLLANNVQKRYTEKEKEKEKEIDIDIDIEKSKKSKNNKELFTELVGNYSIPPGILGQLESWIKYKTERREGYKPEGMKSLLRQVENKSKIYSVEAINDLIETCKSNGYKGIIWDKINSSDNKDKIATRVSQVDSWV